MKTRVFCTVFLLIIVFGIPLAKGAGEIDASTVVTHVIEGDTFETETEGKIKLADVDPTCADIDNSTGYTSAKIFLSSIIEGKTVYLDKDKKYGTDYSGTGNRTVCVVYVDFNSTHYLNVNSLMFRQRLLAINDQDNDFNPDIWTIFVNKQNIPEFSVAALIIIFAIILIAASMISKKID